MTKDQPFDPSIARRVHGRRRGKALRPVAKALVSDLLPKLEISGEALTENLRPEALFSGAVREVWLEIGFGKGEHLAWQAERNPEVGFIGVEPFIDGVASLLREVQEKSLANIRVFRDDARFFADHLAPASIDRCFLLFPDPWPKARHHKRRFVNPANLEALARIIKPGAEFRIGTDHADYGRWILAHMLRQPWFDWMVERPADCLTRPDDWPGTRYEAKGAREGRPSIYLRYRRNEVAIAS